MSCNEDMIKACPANSVMLDIGANVGGYTRAMAEKASRVFAFEPEPKNLEKLRESVKEFRNVKIQEMALSNFTGTTKLMLHPGNPGAHSIHVPLDGQKWKHKLEHSIEVKVMKLDDWCSARGLTSIAGMKIDVEAHELEVLQGAEETLKRDHPLIALETHHMADMAAIGKFLRECGYEVPKLEVDHCYLIQVASGPHSKNSA